MCKRSKFALFLVCIVCIDLCHFVTYSSNMKKIGFRIKELAATKGRRDGERISYADIHEATGISPNSLSMLATGKSKHVGISTIERLLDYFECGVGELIEVCDSD